MTLSCNVGARNFEWGREGVLIERRKSKLLEGSWDMLRQEDFKNKALMFSCILRADFKRFGCKLIGMIVSKKN